MGLSKEDGDLIVAYDQVLKDGPRATYQLWRRWDPNRRLKYIAHMKKLAAQDPEQFLLFSDIVAKVAANYIGD